MSKRNYSGNMTLDLWMEENNITPHSLAEKLGVHWSLVYKWKQGTRRPRKNNMLKLFEISGNQIDANSFYQ